MVAEYEGCPLVWAEDWTGDVAGHIYDLKRVPVDYVCCHL